MKQTTQAKPTGLTDEAILAAFQTAGRGTGPKVLGRYRGGALIGRIASTLENAKGNWVTYVHLVRALKADPAKVARRLRTMSRHGASADGWKLETSSTQCRLVFAQAPKQAQAKKARARA